jgi:arabinofuranan 3-O-arabinosyltransferase
METNSDRGHEAGMIREGSFRVVRWLLAAPSVLAGLISGLTVFLTWFERGAFYATGDVSPMVKPSLGEEMTEVWTHQNSAAGGATWEIARSWEWLFSQVERLPIADVATGQHLLFSFCFGFAAAGSAAFAKRFLQRSWLAALVGVIVAWSPHGMLQMPSPLGLVAVGVIGFTLSFAIDESKGSRVSRLAWLAAWVPASYVMLNPPLIALCFASLAVAPLFALIVTQRCVPFLVQVRRHITTASVVGLGAVWWLVPAVIAYLGAKHGDAVRAQTDVLAWSWTHRNSSIANVLRLRAHWAHPDGFYNGAANMLDSFPWNVTLWMLPVAAFGALWLAREKRAARWMVGFVAVLVFLSKGVHEPLGSVNAYLFKNVPGMFLFREPFSKFGLFIALFMAVLGAMAAEGAIERLKGRGQAAMLVWLLFPALSLTTAFPVYTGSLARTNSSQVKVPQEWFEVAEHVNSSATWGRVLVLPLADFYQMPTTWGYYGIDSLPRQLITRPVVQRIPEAYIGDRPQYDALMRATERALAGNDMKRAASLFDALGVSHIVLRHDYDLDDEVRKPRLRLTSAALTSVIPSIDGARRTLSTSVADVFELKARPSVMALAPVAEAAYDDSTRVASEDSRAILRTATDAGAALVPASLLPKGAASAWITPGSVGTFTPKASGIGTLVSTGAASYRIEVGAQTRLVDITAIGADGKLVPTRHDIVIAPRPVEVLIVDGELYRNGDVVTIGAATPVQVTVSETSTGVTKWGPLADCNRYDNTSFSENRMKLTNSAGTLRLEAGRHAACTSIEIPRSGKRDLVEVTLETRSTSGAAARVCLLVDDSCVPGRTEPLDGGWSRLRLKASSESAAKLYAYADEPSESGVTTITEYRNVTVTSMVADPAMYISPSPLHSLMSLGVVGSVSRIDVTAGGPLALGEVGKLADCASTDARTPKDLGMSVTAAGNNIVLSAREHKACVKHTLEVEPHVAHTLAFTGSFTGAQGIGVCVWDRAESACMNQPLVVQSAKATRYELEFISTSPEVELFYYADAKGGRTEVSYENIQLTLTPSARLAVTPETVEPAARVTEVRGGSPKWTAVIEPQQNVDEPVFVLTTRESFDPHWKLSGLPGSATAVPTLVDGYRQGWVVSNLTETATVTIAYRGRTFGAVAFVVSLIVLCAAALFGLRGSMNARRMRRQAELLRENDAALASLESAAILRQLVEGEAGTNPATSLE